MDIIGGSTTLVSVDMCNAEFVEGFQKVNGNNLRKWEVQRMPSQKSDMERFIELYKSFGINLTATKFNKLDNYYTVVLNEYVSEKFGGYGGFGSCVNFDRDGKFINQEFYE